MDQLRLYYDQFLKLSTRDQAILLFMASILIFRFFRFMFTANEMRERAAEEARKKKMLQDELKEEMEELKEMRNQYLTVDNPIEAKKEFKVPIHEMYIYPIRGIRATTTVDYLDVTMHGVKFDREIVLLDATNLKVVTSNKYHPMCCLRQEFKDNTVTVTTMHPERLTKKGLSPKMVIPLDKSEYYGDQNNHIEGERGYEGFCM